MNSNSGDYTTAPMSFVEEVSNTSSHDEFDSSVALEDEEVSNTSSNDEFDLSVAVEDEEVSITSSHDEFNSSIDVEDEFDMLANDSDTLLDDEFHLAVNESSYMVSHGNIIHFYWPRIYEKLDEIPSEVQVPMLFMELQLKECFMRLDICGHRSVTDMEVRRVVKMEDELQYLLQVEMSKIYFSEIVSNMDIPLTCVESIPMKINDMAGKAHQVGKKTVYIVVEIEVLILIQEDEDREETLAAALRESIDDMAYQRTSAVPASKSSIEALERMKFNKGKYDEIKCTICLNDFSTGMEVVRMPCSHVFYSECILQWLEINHVCPLCWFEMPPQQFEEI